MNQKPETRLLELLAGYDVAIRTAEACRWFVVLPSGDGPRLPRIPRPTFLLRYFVVQHVAKRVSELDRAYSRRIALDVDEGRALRQRERLEDFRRSLPSVVSRRVLVVLVVLGVLVLMRLWLAHVSSPSHVVSQGDLRLLETLEDSILSFNVESNALKALATTPLGIILDFAYGLLLMAYFILRPSWSSFRLKRLLFNEPDADVLVRPHEPDADGLVRARTIHEGAMASNGIYRLEAAAFTEAGIPARREFPYDLALSALLAVGVFLPIGIAGMFEGMFTGTFEDAAASAVILGATLARVSWLACAAHGRLHPGMSRYRWPLSERRDDRGGPEMAGGADTAV